MKPYIICVLSILFSLSIVPATVIACSGNPSFPIEDLDLMNVLVKATVIDTDDRGYNAILRIEDYYKGSGDQLIVVKRYPAGLEATSDIRGYDTNCLYAGQGHRWHKGSQGYFGLNPNSDGTYTDFNSGTAHFYVWDGQITYRNGATEGFAIEFDDPNIMSEDEFVARLLELGEREEPLAPTIDDVQHYPLMRYLNVTTENGTRYQINPDRSIKQLAEGAPLSIAPDGSHMAFKLDEQTIGFQYYWMYYLSEDSPYITNVNQIELSGEQVRFSNDSNMVAVWDDAQLTVYLFEGRDPNYFGDLMQMHAIVSIPLETPTSVMWSADSSTLAWEDATGIWYWNLFEQADASQIPDATGLLDLSTYGQYVRYGEPTDWTLYDSETGNTYAQALSAPTEQFLIFIDAQERPLHDWRADYDCTPPLQDNCAVYLDSGSEYESVQVFPYQWGLIGWQGCGTEGYCDLEGIPWHPSIVNNGNRGGRYIYTLQADVRQVAYDPFYDQPAILTGDYRIDFEFVSTSRFEEPTVQPYLDYVDLAGLVDSPIMSIEWGQPIFYNTFMMSATEYLP